jgi:glycosyltransferase involved in cell wall biosynthesis
MNRDLIPELRITWLEPMLKRHNPRMIFDFDDAIFIGKREQKLRKILPYFAWLTPGNLYLAEFAKKINSKISIWPTVIDTNRYYPVYKKRSEQIRIGWSGSKGNLRYLSIIERPIREMAKQVNIEFVVISDINPNLDWDNVQIRYIPWSEFSEVNDLQEIDIGLMPLHDGPFERGKCGFKAISYMGIGIPALVSPVGVNKEIVIHGETGFHCKNDEEWTHYLKLLMKDSGLRYLMGKRARTRIEELYSVNFLLPYMVEIFKLLAS